jgi:hypothetical protein
MRLRWQRLCIRKLSFFSIASLGWSRLRSFEISFPTHQVQMSTEMLWRTPLLEGKLFFTCRLLKWKSDWWKIIRRDNQEDSCEANEGTQGIIRIFGLHVVLNDFKKVEWMAKRNTLVENSSSTSIGFLLNMSAMTHTDWLTDLNTRPGQRAWAIAQQIHKVKLTENRFWATK